MRPTCRMCAVGIAVGILGSAGLARAQWVEWSGNGHFYKPVSVDNITWDAAESAAVSAGGYLATITSAEENEFVFSLIDYPQYWNMADYTMGPWLGGYQPPGSQEPAGGWSWVTGEPFSYTHWSPLNPNNDPNENCLHFCGDWGGPPSSYWNDATANGTGRAVRGYVIESLTPEPATMLLALAGAGLLARPRRARD